MRRVTVTALAAVLAVGAAGCEDPAPGDGVGGPTPTPAQTPAPAAEDDPSGTVLLIMDASGSMREAGPDGATRLDSAKQALRELVSALPDGQHVGLRVYGHRVPNTDRDNGCQDTELIHPVAPLDRPALTAAIDGYDAVGFTPIGLSLREAVGDLPAEGPRTVVLVSDGEDTCAPPEPCDVAGELAAGGIDLVINTVGFALEDDAQARAELECIARAGGGEFRDVETAPELAEALQESTRDPREATLAGAELPGAPLPRDAATGRLDTPYTDTVLGGETNFWRFEVPPGTEARAEVITSYDRQIGDCEQTKIEIHLVDAGDSRFLRSGGTIGLSTRPGENATHHTNYVSPDAGEVFLRVRASTYSGGDEGRCEGVPLDLEIQMASR